MMEETDLEKYKSAWGKERSFSDKTLTETDIRNYLKKRSSELTRSFRAGLIIDIVIKVLLVVSFVSISFLFSGMNGIKAICFISVAIIILLMFFQISTYRKIPKRKEYSDNIKDFLKGKTEFYRERYIKSVYVTAMSNPFILLAGMMFYFSHKYGSIGPLGLGDYLVFGLLGIIGFALGVITQIKQFGFQINQMEACLSELDENGVNEHLLRKHVIQRRIVLLVVIIAVVTGLLLLLFLTTNLI